MSLVCSMQVSAQKVNPVVGLSQTVSFLWEPYYGTSLSAGVRFNMGTGYFELKGSYMLLAIETYSVQSHQFGGNITYRVLSAQKRLSPYLELNAYSEVGTNYKDGYLRMDSSSPQSQPEAYSYANSHGGPWYTTYYSRFYHSIPFVGNILAGIDVRIINGLHFNVGCGFGYRGMSTRTIEWSKGVELTQEILHQRPIGTMWFNLIDLKFGLTYAFSTKKTTK